MREDQHPPLAFVALLFGAAGFMAGILMAPKSGLETRQHIVTRKNEFKDQLAKMRNEMKSKASKTSEVARNAKSDIQDILEE